jgi:1-acyl-sn-glycerol-3-phosphate acyltransferase
MPRRRPAAGRSLPRHGVHAWLPDAALDAHPVGTWLLQAGFDLWLRAAYRRVTLVAPGFRLPPGALIASNHQRDVDGPMLGIGLVQRRGLRFERPLPFYATREDLFRPGILARLTVHWPRPLSALLGRVSLAWFFPLGRAEPMRRVREFTLGETLAALADAGLGDADCAAVLNARGRRETGLAPGAASVRAALHRPGLPIEAWWGLRRLRLAALRRLAPAFRATVDAQLAHFAHRLDAGRAVYFAPEGTISIDGHFGRVRAGSFRLARMAATAPWIQPMALQYDALAPGRLRAIVHIGAPVRADPALPRGAFDAALKRLMFRTVPITPSQLLARWLRHGPPRFTEADLARYFAAARRALGATGTPLDPLLAGSTTRELANQRLRWLERQQLVRREGDTFVTTCARTAAPGWNDPAAIVHYLDNQLGDLLPDAARRLPC